MVCSPMKIAAFFLIAVLLWPMSGAAQVGNSCTTNGTVGTSNPTGTVEGLLLCSSGAWVYPAVQIGSTSATCNSTNAGTLQWTGSAFQICTGSSWTTYGIYDLATFYPGSPPASAITRVVSVRAATFPSSLTGSDCVAKSGATASTTININKIHSGSSSNVGSITFAASGSANQTCTLSATASFSLAVGDALEFAFPSSPDATLADVAVTLAGTYQ